MREPTDSAGLVWILERSEVFERAISACFPEDCIVHTGAQPQRELVTSACLLCIEHARVLRAAFAIAAPNSGATLLRLQFEALLRAAWLQYAASPSQIDKLTRSLDKDAEQAANGLPGNADMLRILGSKAPQALVMHLAEFDLYSRRALNSFVHSGIHPLRRVRDGFPTELAETLVRFSNGLGHFAFRMMASTTGSQPLMDKVTRVYSDFTDCVPMAKSQPTGPSG